MSGTVDVVNEAANDDEIDLHKLDKTIFSTLTTLVEEHDSDSVTSFLVSLQYARDDSLGMAVNVELSLAEATEKQLPVVNALVQEDVVSDKSFTDSLNFFIACGCFVVVIILVGYLIYLAGLKEKSNANECKPRSRSATATHRSFNPSPCNLLVSANDDKSSNDGVGTSDLQWQCGLASVCTDLEFSRPKRRPYPYAVTAGSGSVNGKESKASDMSLRMSKSTMSIRH